MTSLMQSYINMYHNLWGFTGIFIYEGVSAKTFRMCLFPTHLRIERENGYTLYLRMVETSAMWLSDWGILRKKIVVYNGYVILVLCAKMEVLTQKMKILILFVKATRKII